MSARIIERWFPNLTASTYRITSEITEDYNCFAWAAHETRKRFDPTALPDCDWLPTVPRTPEVDSFVSLYLCFGFESCTNGLLQEGVEKIAIYVDHNGEPTHAARQLASGKWTSKLGDFEDIEHETLSGLEGTRYGTACVFLQRKRA